MNEPDSSTVPNGTDGQGCKLLGDGLPGRGQKRTRDGRLEGRGQCTSGAHTSTQTPTVTRTQECTHVRVPGAAGKLIAAPPSDPATNRGSRAPPGDAGDSSVMNTVSAGGDAPRGGGEPAATSTQAAGVTHVRAKGRRSTCRTSLRAHPKVPRTPQRGGRGLPLLPC